MYYLERVFYSIAALTACMAILVFGLYFDIGNMIMAAVNGPSAFAEWNFKRNLRAAVRHSAPDEILPDQSNRSITSQIYRNNNPNGGSSVSRLFAPPGFSMRIRKKRIRNRLARQGFTAEPFLELETLFQVERTHHGALAGIDRLIARGNKMEALNELDRVIDSVNPNNLRSLTQLYRTKMSLILALQAPPDQIYDLTMSRLEMLKRIAEIEIEGYSNVPKYAAELARAVSTRVQLEAEIGRLRQNRTLAFKVIDSGIPAGKMPASFARVLKASAKRKAESDSRYSSAGAEDFMKMIDTLPKPTPRVEEDDQ